MEKEEQARNATWSARASPTEKKKMTTVKGRDLVRSLLPPLCRLFAVARHALAALEHHPRVELRLRVPTRPGFLWGGLGLRVEGLGLRVEVQGLGLRV